MESQVNNGTIITGQTVIFCLITKIPSLRIKIWMMAQYTVLQKIIQSPRDGLCLLAFISLSLNVQFPSKIHCSKFNIHQHILSMAGETVQHKDLYSMVYESREALKMRHMIISLTGIVTHNFWHRQFLLANEEGDCSPHHLVLGTSSIHAARFSLLIIPLSLT